LVVEVMDRLYPGIDVPEVVFSPRRIRTIARFEADPEERIVISRPMARRLGRSATASAVRRESVRAGLWVREGILRGPLFEDEMRRAGELSGPWRRPGRS
jgi:hypothetical protein